MFNYPLKTSNYEILHLVGSGTYSRVYESNCRDNNQVIAIKQINLDEFPLELETIQRQTAFWSKCEHPNIVKYYGSFMDDSTLWILNEYMGAGSLKDIIKLSYKGGFRNEQLIAAILYQVVAGVKFFHDNHEIHRDIRTNNILVNSEGFVKLGDFGLATSLVKGGTRQGSTLSLFGEECYMAPEVLRNENGYSEKTDIWSLGLTAIELGTGKMPYAGMKFMESLVQIIDHDPPSLPDSKEYSSAYKDFVKQCLMSDPTKRATASELLNHRFLRQFTGSNLTSSPNLLSNPTEKSNNSPTVLIKQELASKLPPLYEIYQKLHQDKDSLPIRKNPSSQMVFDFSSVEKSDNNNDAQEEKTKEKEEHKHHHKHSHKHKHHRSTKNKQDGDKDKNEEKKKSHKRKHKTKSSDSENNDKDSANANSESDSASQSESYSESDSKEEKKKVRKSKKRKETKHDSDSDTNSDSENNESDSNNYSYSESDEYTEKTKRKDKSSKKHKSKRKSIKAKDDEHENSSKDSKEEKKEVQKVGRFSVTRTESLGVMPKKQASSAPTVVASVSRPQSSSQNLEQKQRIEKLANEIATLGNELTRLENENQNLKNRLDEVVGIITQLQNEK